TLMPVLPGTYIAAVSATGQIAGSTTAPAQGVMIGNDKVTQQPLHTSFVYTAGSTTPAWGYITNLPMIRLNILKGPAGIQEHNLDMALISAYPNPAMQSVSINYQLNKSSDVVISVTDITGKQVGTIKEHAIVGQHTTHLDLGAYASGTYFYTLTTDFGKLNGKFVVTK
ncbi:MAG TPA: T9SS type A sorting domain-containing protein, partial [Bacteroidia bacterium]|nr:T9SS type A sorting domain-containing protein [Bacteroidia bacterium]